MTRTPDIRQFTCFNLLVMITLVITTTFRYPTAVGEARMLQPTQDGAFPRAEPPRSGFETSLALCSRIRGGVDASSRNRPDAFDLYYDKARTVLYDWR